MRGPTLVPGVVLIEQNYRDQLTFVLKDPQTQKYYRFRPAEAEIIRTFDGSRTVEEIVQHLADRGRALSTATIEGFARTLSRLGLLERTLAERTEHQLERLRTERRQQRSLFRGEWLRMRWGFTGANVFFDRWMPAVRWCFTPAFVAGSLLLFLAYAWIIASQWSDFQAAVAATFAPAVFSWGTVGMLVATLLVLTLIHELGHGFACKHFGGEVHELGFMLLYFTPAFYCNVNDAWSFPALRSRLWVTLAGTWIELTVSALAAIVWFVVHPDTALSQWALAAMLIGGFMAIVTNGNPLLPLDGYFALSDYLEMPNLRHRASAHVTWWVRRHVLKLDLPEPDVAPNERRTLLLYGFAAMAYITGLAVLIGSKVIHWVAAMAGFAVAALVLLVVLATILPRMTAFWRGSLAALRAQVGGTRWRQGRRWLGITGGLTLLISAVLPWRLQTFGEFVVAPQRSAVLLAPDSGVVVAVYPTTGTSVSAGTPVLRLLDFGLVQASASQRRLGDSLGLEALVAQARTLPGIEAVRQAEAASAGANLARTNLRRDQGVVRAPFDGTVITTRPEELLGRQVAPGDTLLVIADLMGLEARISLRSAGASQIVPGGRVRLISAQAADHPVEGVVREVAPAGIGAAGGAVEVRMTLADDAPLRAGATGMARVEWGRSTLLGSLWWAVRSRIRNDLLL